MLPEMVAVPYYGILYRARLGYERIFFFVNFGGGNESHSEVRLGVWDNRKEEALPAWLKSNGIDGVVCRDQPEANLLQKMKNLGISIITDKDREAKKLMQNLMV